MKTLGLRQPASSGFSCPPPRPAMIPPLRLHACLLTLTASLLPAAERTWTGAADTDFANPANWIDGLVPSDDLTTDTARFSDPPSNHAPALSASRSITGLTFSTLAGGGSLFASDPAHALSLGAYGLNASAQSSGTTLVSASLALGATQTWSVGTGATLRLTGSIRAGSPTSDALAGQLLVGSGSHAGDLVLDPAPGNSVEFFTTLVSAGSVQVNQRLLLGSASGSTASVNTVHNSSGAGIRIATTGVLGVRSGTWLTNDLGSNNTSAFTGTLEISGGTLATGGARYLGQFNGSAGTTVHLSGGTLRVTGGGNVVANSGHLGLGAHGANSPSGTIRFNITGGGLEVARASGNFPAGSGISSAALSLGGVAGTTVLLNQSGGTVRVGVAPGANVFTGTTNTNTFANLSIGSNFTANRAAYTLSGGSLTVAGGIVGLASPEGVSNFNFLGGTLATATFDTTRLGRSSTATHTSDQVADSLDLGTLVNRGGTLAPGGPGTAGRTVITGNYRAASGALALDLDGATQATSFQHDSGHYDFLGVSGTATLGGDLLLNVLPGFTPISAQTFTVLSASAGLSGSFTNAPHGTRVFSADGLHSFVATQTATSLSLGDYLPVLAPTISVSSAPTVVAEGDAVLLGVSVNSLGPVTYEWYRDGVLLPDLTSSTLTLLDFQSADAGLYSVIVRNAAGSATREFSVRVTTPPTAVAVIVDAGASHTFAAAPGAVSYKWILDGEPVGSPPSFTWSPARREVGTHWLRVVETLPDATTVTRHWTVRVRLPIPASAVFLHVSPSGSDTNDGSATAPFLTLERSRTAIRALTAGQRAGGVTVYLRGGIHRRTTSFVLSAQDSGTEAAPVVYAAYPGETPVLTGTRVINAAQWSPLASSEHARVAPGVDVARVWELDVSGNARAAAFPNIFNEWTIFNALRSSQNGGLLEVFQNGERRLLSRYPNHHPSNDTLTTSLRMDGVAAGSANDGSGFLNGAGTYTRSDGATASVGCAFHYPAEEDARIARWNTALSRGGVWLAGYWRVPWQINGLRVNLIDPGKRVIAFTSTPNLGIGDKYNRPLGTKREPWWALNLLEEMDVPGEWAVDFSRQRLYFLMDRAGPPADGEIELSDVGTVLFQLNGASDVVLRGLTFRRHLGINVQILDGTRNLVLACRFEQAGNVAVEIRNGTQHGVLSSDFDKLAAGGIMLRGGATSPSLAFTDHFAVNNRFRSFGEVVRVYQAAIDAGYGGPLGTWSQVAVGMRVAQNDIRTTPHAAILWNGHRHVIEYNEVSDFTRISNDFGAIYRYGPNADSETVIRFNHLFSSPQGEGIYNDFDHVRTPIYGNTLNLKTPASAHRGYGFWSNTPTGAGQAVPDLPTTLRVFNNIAVNSRENFVLHSSIGGRIEHNVSFRPLTAHHRWRRISTNTSTHTHTVTTSDAATLASGPNPAYSTDPGFIDFANDDLRLRPDAQVYRDLPAFVPIPLELAGLRADEHRPATDTRGWTPFVVTGTAYSVGVTSATFAGTLVYPQFDANATVRVYWGTHDGGTDPAAWHHVAVLGQPGSGHLAHTRADLAPGTRYFFRFHAQNFAGEHWAERSNFTTTFVSEVTPDTTGPVITTPGHLVVSGSNSGATVTFEVSAEDALSGYVPATATPPSGSFFPVGDTTITVTASDALGNPGTATFTVTVLPPTLPAPWTIRQINPFAGVAPGTVEVNSATSFTIVGAGGASTGGTTADLWTGTNDSNTHVSIPWQGDGTFTARLASFTSTDSSAKAGLIFRETTTAGSRYSTIYMIRNNGGAVLFQHKTATNGATSGTNFFNGSVTNRGIPEWLRLVREGDTFSTFYSEDGASWTLLSSRANLMSGATLSVGFVVAPRTGGTTATATFDHISFLSPLQTWRHTHFGTTANTGSAADLADPNGDGIPNLLAYALGRSPLAPSSTPPWQLDLVGTDESDAPHLRLSFHRIADPALIYTVEASSSLAPESWTPVWQSTGSSNSAGPVTVADPLDLTSEHPRRFLRLRVHATP
jgi:hypothetical protein